MAFRVRLPEEVPRHFVIVGNCPITTAANIEFATQTRNDAPWEIAKNGLKGQIIYIQSFGSLAGDLRKRRRQYRGVMFKECAHVINVGMR